MTELTFFHNLIIFWFILACISFPVLFFFPVSYGRYMRKKLSCSIPGKWGWVIMELPAVLVFGTMFFIGTYNTCITAIVFLLMWMLHYIQRSLIYPFLRRGREKRMPLNIIFLGIIFNLVNGYINGRYLFEFSGGYSDEWLTSWQFLTGTGLFVFGYIINRNADLILHNLRKPEESVYKVPYGGLYKWISCPNYLGEILVWIGWAIATWSLPGLSFAVWTVANLVPRAWSYHKWYQTNFDNYPQERKALIPLLW